MFSGKTLPSRVVLFLWSSIAIMTIIAREASASICQVYSDETCKPNPVTGIFPPCRGDGYCDSECNNAANQFDGGDCCEHTCHSSSDFDCGEAGYDCLDEECDDTGGVGSTGGHNIKVIPYVSHNDTFYYLWMDCCRRTAVRFMYEIRPDRVNYDRADWTKDDRKDQNNNRIVSDACQPKSVKTFKHPECMDRRKLQEQPCYDRGHLAMANHLDRSAQAMRSTFYGPNMVPQLAAMNQSPGTWGRIEDILECQRDEQHLESITVVGGMIFNDTSNDDWSVSSHGMPTPDAFWRVHVRYYRQSWNSRFRPPKVDAWLLPHSLEYARTDPDRWRVSVSTIRSVANDFLSEVPASYIAPESSYDTIVFRKNKPQLHKCIGDPNQSKANTEAWLEDNASTMIWLVD